jgi:hypothetical protein
MSSKSHRLPDHFVDEWQSKACGLTFFGVLVEGMRYSELLATISFFADRYKHDPFPRPAEPAPVPHEGYTYTVIGGNL